MKTYIGIDPGKKGSLAVLHPEGEMHVYPTPIIELKKNDYDVGEMYELLVHFKLRNDMFCVIEKSQAMPGQGVTSMFSIGKGYGIWLGLLNACSIPFVEVHPATWTRTLLRGSGGQGKERNYSKARQLFPDWKPKFKYEREYADSILLAKYGEMMGF